MGQDHLQFHANPLGADSSQITGPSANRRGGVGFDVEIETGRETNRPQQAEVILPEPPIRIPDGLESDELVVFHAGTAARDGQLVTSGGRVLAVTALAPTFAAAADASREGAARIEFDGAFFRGDIGWQELTRQAT